MSGKTFVGNRAQALRESDKLQPYTKVTVTDGTNSYSSGDDTGRELLVEVPVLPNGDGATLAANILASVAGYQYRPYEADSALLDPAAELGDGITVGGVYGGIHAKTTTFSRLLRANVSAPAEEEIDSEYPYLSAQERDAVRQKKQTAKNTADIAGNTASIGTLNTQVANISELVADKASISSLNAAVARISTLESSQITTSYLSSNYASVSSLNAAKSRITNLETSVANVDALFANSGYSGTLTAHTFKCRYLNVGDASGSYRVYSPTTITYKNGSGTNTSIVVLARS